MKYRGPVITLLAVAALAAVLLVVNMRTVAETAARGTTAPAVPSGNAQPGANPQGNEPSGNGRSGNGQPPVVTQPPPPPSSSPPGPPPVVEPPAVEPVKYAGRTSGNEATIAIVVEGEAVSAYVCDGARVESWLDGTARSGRLDLRGRHGATVTGAIQDGAVFGTMRVQGRQWPYSAQAAEAPAGLYEGRGRVNGAPTRVGWIVRQDGSQVGVADVGGASRPAPALDPRRLRGVEVGGTVIVPRPVGGSDDVLAPPS